MVMSMYGQDRGEPPGGGDEVPVGVGVGEVVLDGVGDGVGELVVAVGVGEPPVPPGPASDTSSAK
jgi:hypothetical protein